MTAEDITLGLRLREQAGWNQTAADWRRFLDLAPGGCFVGELDGTPVATTTTCLLGTVGWIAMVLVDESARHRGLGTRLVEHAVAHLFSCGAKTVRLDATAQGRPVYERLGFVADYELARMHGTSRPPGNAGADISPVKSSDLDSLVNLDRRATGTDRRALISMLIAGAPSRACEVVHGDTISGYALWRPGSHALTLGPAVAQSPPDGIALMDGVLAACRGQPVFVDVPLNNRPAMDWAHARGLDVQRRLMRMHLGIPVNDRTDQIWASSGPEKG